MSSKWFPEQGIPGRAERQRIRERAEQILAQARLLCERLDQIGGPLALSLEADALRGGPSPLQSKPGPRLRSR